MSKIEISKELILKTFQLNDSEVLSIFPYGSRVYGTNSNSSDHDFIIVMDKDIREFALNSDDKSMNVHLYSPDGFVDQCRQHKIAALECLSLPKERVLKQLLKMDMSRGFILDKEKLRASISEKASHSWVKAKKKFEVEADRDVYIAKKSLFHSLRIIDFGTQIAKSKKIENYSSSNDLWFEIRDNTEETWEPYHEKYHKLFNERMIEFRKFAPKGK